MTWSRITERSPDSAAAVYVYVHRLNEHRKSHVKGQQFLAPPTRDRSTTQTMALLLALLSLLLSPALAQVFVTVDPFNGDDAACSSAQEKMGGGACKLHKSCVFIYTDIHIKYSTKSSLLSLRSQTQID